MRAVLFNRILIVLAFLGIFIAGVLSEEAGMNLLVPCGGSGGCQIVAASPYSHFAGIPVAYFGLGGYLVLAALAAFRSFRPVASWTRSVTLGYLVAAVGSAISLYLQYQSFYNIHATCLWCLSSAITMIVILVVYALLAQQVENAIASTSGVELEPDSADATAVANPASPLTFARPEYSLTGALFLVVLVGLGTMSQVMRKGRLGATPAPSTADFKQLVPPGAHILGRPDSPVTVVEFADLCCPTCQKISPEVKQYVLDHPGKVRLVFRNFPLANLHKEAMTAAAIAECAADQNRFWEYTEAVMALQRQPKDLDELLSIAKSTGLDDNKIRQRLQNNDDPIYTRLGNDMKSVHAIGLNQTPTFFTMFKDKTLETVSGNEIIDTLNSDKYQKMMNGIAPPPDKK